MNRIGHIFVGLLFAVVFICITNVALGWFSIFDWRIYIYGSVIVLLYSLLPDVDLESGTITWFFLGMGILGAIIGVVFNQYLLYFSLGLLVLTFLAVKLTHHRGFIHTMWCAVLFAIPMYFILNLEFACLAFVSFYSHLLADGYLFKLR